MEVWYPLKLCISILLSALFLFFAFLPVFAEEPALSLNAKAAILMEASTGRILYEKNIDEAFPPASVTKIMTMLLTMEAIDRGQISYDTIVTASENAKRLGGSTIFLDTGEKISVYDLLKGIAVASGNDASMAIAEHLAGSEAEFVRQMNLRAKELGMENTNFVNCNGLDAEGHKMSARDIAIMSRELIKHEKIFEFTTIWTDSLRDGEFGLANTNKLIRFYEGANGLKTGSTDAALYCLSATAKRGDMQLIAVIMGAPSTAERFGGARTLLDYGFATYTLSRTENTKTPVHLVKVEKGATDTAPLCLASPFTALLEKSKTGEVETRFEVSEPLTAPLYKGDTVGKALFYLGEECLGEVPLTVSEDVPKKTLGHILTDLFARWCAAA